jgi:hypothetical protein
MPDLKDLRVGNAITYISRSRKAHLPVAGVFRIIALGEVDCTLASFNKIPATLTDGEKFTVRYSDLCEIPLTSEILEKCGFEKTTIDRVVFWEIKVGKFGKFQFYKGVMQFGILGVGNYEYHDVQPKYLHQLQSLYYSLTNTELNFKP